jgi:flagellar motor switch protein FliN/FliY
MSETEQPPPEAPLKAPDRPEATVKAPEKPLETPDNLEAPLKAPDATEQQAEQQSPFRLASLAEEEPAAVTEGTPAAVAEDPPAAVAEDTTPVEPARFPDLGPDLGTGATPDGAFTRGVAQALDIRLLSDIPLEVTVELGRAVLTVNQLLALRPGSVVELTAGASTVDVVVNGRLVARGDVVVVGDSFGVRVTEIVEP